MSTTDAGTTATPCESAAESPLWRLGRPLAVLHIAAFFAAGTLGVLDHLHAAALVLGVSNGVAVLWAIPLIAFSPHRGHGAGSR